MPLFGYLGHETAPGSWSAWSAHLAALILAGISVFGTENRARTQAFLTNHGVAPHLVWLVKVGTWLAALAGPRRSCSPLVHFVHGVLFLRRGSKGISESVALGLGLSDHRFRGRRALRHGHPPRDHGGPGVAGLLDRCWPSPWAGLSAHGNDAARIRLAASPGAARGELRLEPRLDARAARGPAVDQARDSSSPARSRCCSSGTYAAYRVASVPSLDPARDAELFTFSTPTSVPESENAAALYRKADSEGPSRGVAPVRWPELNRLIEEGWDPKAEEAISWYRERAGDLVPIRKAAELPYCRFEPDREADGIHTDPSDLPSLIRCDDAC